MSAKRRERTTKKQFEIILNYLEENKDLLNFDKSASNFSTIEKKWANLVEKLNTSNSGPQKSVKEWKNVIREWKTNIKKKARDISEHVKGTGGGPKSNQKLNDLEERLLSLLNKIIIDCAPNISEPGLTSNYAENSVSSNINLMFENIGIDFFRGEDIVSFVSNEDSLPNIVSEHDIHQQQEMQTKNVNVSNNRSTRKRKRPASNIESVLDSHTKHLQALVESNINIAILIRYLADTIK